MLKRRLKQAGLPRHYRLIHFERPASRIFWKMTAPLKPHSAAPATPTEGPRSSMTVAARRCYSRIWRGFGINLIRTRQSITPPVANEQFGRSCNDPLVIFGEGGLRP